MTNVNWAWNADEEAKSSEKPVSEALHESENDHKT